MTSVITTAGRRGITANTAGEVTLILPSLHEAKRESQKVTFIAALGRNWTSRAEAMTRAARYLGFGRVSPEMRTLYASLINGLIREGRIESDLALIRRSQRR